MRWPRAKWSLARRWSVLLRRQTKEMRVRPKKPIAKVQRQARKGRSLLPELVYFSFDGHHQMTLVVWGSLCSLGAVENNWMGGSFLKNKLMFAIVSKLVRRDQETVLIHPMSIFVVRHLRWLRGPIWVSCLFAGLPASGKQQEQIWNLDDLKIICVWRSGDIKVIARGEKCLMLWPTTNSVLYTKKGLAASLGMLN